MKELTKYNRVAGYLEKIYRLINERFFENALSIPVITIQSTPDAYGHVSINKRWDAGGEKKRELNIGAGTLNRPIEDITATLVHEMVHIFNSENNIKDTSRGNTYHNKKFKEAAEARGLIIEHHDKYGWTITSPADDLIQACIDWDLVDIRINRIEMYGIPVIGGTGGKISGDERPKAKSSTRKYQCPKCGDSVRATKAVNIMCCSGKHDQPYVMSEV